MKTLNECHDHHRTIVDGKSIARVLTCSTRSEERFSRLERFPLGMRFLKTWTTSDAQSHGHPETSGASSFSGPVDAAPQITEADIYDVLDQLHKVIRTSTESWSFRDNGRGSSLHST